MRMYDIISKKRDGEQLSVEEITFFVEEYTKGTIPDYQAAALLMAIYLNGMTDDETVALTKAMAFSGDTVDLSRFGALSVDKHSTGGVGDKTTLIISPIVAACGCKVTKMSGRGLGHTGGTVDKLESIPGYKTTLFNEEFLSQTEKIGLSVIGQSGNLTPADKKIYALRDSIAAVESIPLITSSIMSKKIAAGAKNLLLDVKCGSGAFMKNVQQAEILAQNMVKIGKMCGINTAAIITDMNTPLGNAVGNNLEVIEAVSVLKGEQKDELYEVSLFLAGNMISLVHGISVEQGIKKAQQSIENKTAFNKFCEWIAAQGGDLKCINNTELFKKAKYSFEVRANKDGFIAEMDTEKIGTASMLLGAGRQKKGDLIDSSAGIIISAKTGDKIYEGEKIATLYTNDESSLENAERMYLSAISIQSSCEKKQPLIYKTFR